MEELINLKSQAYDIIAKIERLQTELREVNKKIEKLNEKEEGKDAQHN
jgi:hypothetical protein